MDVVPTGRDVSVGGDALILEDLPANFTVGCDTMSFSTKQPFPGFKDIPPGAHLLWVSPTDSSTSRSGHWFYVTEASRQQQQQRKVHVKRWDYNSELLVDVDTGDQGLGETRLQEIFAQLPAYQCDGIPRPQQAQQGVAPLPDFLSNGSIWEQLTSAIHPALLDRIVGGDPKVRTTWPVTTSDRVAGESRLPEEAQLYAPETSQTSTTSTTDTATGNPPSSEIAASSTTTTSHHHHLRFTLPMDAPLISPSASGPERTRQALDPSSFVLSAFTSPDPSQQQQQQQQQRPRQESDLTGELQFAFLTGMHLGNFSCLEQWFFLLHRVVFRSYELALATTKTSTTTTAAELIRCFHAQLAYSDRFLDGDVLDMMPEEAGKVRRALVTYRGRVMEEEGVNGEVKMALGELETWLETTIGWQLKGDSYVRSGKVMLEDGEMVEAELEELEDEDERGEFAAQVVELDEEGREAGLVSWDK